MRSLSIFLLSLLLLLSPSLSARYPKFLDSSFTSLPLYPLPIFESGGAVLQDALLRKHLVIFGGYIQNSNLKTSRAVYALLLTKTGKGTWVKKADMPIDATHTAQASFGSKVYICGGFAGQAPGRTIKECWYYDINQDAWVAFPSLPERRGGGGLVYVKQRNLLLYAGGMLRKNGSWNGKDRGECWMLKLGQKGGWQKKADMPNPRNHMVAVRVSGRLFFVGGQHLNRECCSNQNDVHEYVIWKDKWVQRQDLPKGVGHISASCFSYQGGIVVVGGISDGLVFRDEILYYDVKADVWSEIGKGPRKVQNPVCDKFGQRLVCATGSGKPGNGQTAFMRRLSPPIEQ